MAHRRRAWALAWLFVAASAWTAPAAMQTSLAGRLRGVVDTDTGQPIGDYYVSVSAFERSYRVGAVIDFEEEDIYDREALDQIDLRCVSVVLATGELRVTDLEVTIGQRSGGG